MTVENNYYKGVFLTMNTKHGNLFEQFKFKNCITLKNKIVMSPMTTWSSNNDNTISDEEIEYYKVRVNGVGLVITGCTYVHPNGIGFLNEFASYDDKFIPSLRKLANDAKSGGANAILQIFHAGNKAFPNLVPNDDVVSASAIKTEASAFAPALLPRELSHEEVLDIVNAFGETTRRAIEAGFDGVEIHGAHGFLIQNFTSPLYNKRSDEWGESPEKRLMFPLAIVNKIKDVIKEYVKKPFILGYRLSPEESEKGGLRIGDTYKLINHLIEIDIDYIHISLTSALSSKPIDSKDEKTYLELISKYVNGKVPIIVAGSMLTPDDVEQALNNGASLAAIGRALVINPDWVEKVKNDKKNEIKMSINSSKVNEFTLPQNLWNVIKASAPWINIEE